MKLRETIAAMSGSTLLLIGTGTTAFYGIISYHETGVEWAGLAVGIGLMVAGMLIVKYGAKTTLRGALFILTELWP